jgi:tRNA dimethylallyltransferase
VPHRLYGFLDAAERGSAGQWRELALAEIAAAAVAGRLPILVGGSGLYISALTRGLAPIPPIPEAVRAEARALHRDLGGARFRERLAEVDPSAALRLAAGDSQRLVRAWEVMRATGRPLAYWQAQPHGASCCRPATLLLQPPRAALYAACDARLQAMVEEGGLDEAAALLARGLDPDLPAMKAAGLPELMGHLRGELGRAAAVAAAQRAIRRYAKRQTTWFRHRIEPDLLVDEQFSERLFLHLRHFINRMLLTDQA